MSAPYTTTQAVRMTGVSYRMLDYWDTHDYLSPSVRAANGSGAGKERLYSDEDVRLIKLTKKLLDLGFTLTAIRRDGPDVLDQMVRWELTTVTV